MRSAAVFCGAPQKFARAKPMNTNNGALSPYGSQLTYICPTGFWFSVNAFTATVSCEGIGQWLPKLANDCEGMIFNKTRFGTKIDIIASLPG